MPGRPSGEAAPQVLFDGEDVQLLHFRRDAAVGLLTFDIMHARANGRNAFGKTLAERAGYDLLAVVPKHPCWYPAEEMSRLALVCRERAGPGRIAYGASMGGYGALRWGRTLGARHVLACSPQASIDPAVTGRADRRYDRYFWPDQHRGMEIRPEHLCDGSVVLYDPEFSPDRLHAQRLREAGAVTLALPHMGHATVQCVSGSAHAAAVFCELSEGRTEEMHRRLLARRKQTPAYAPQLAGKAISRKRYGTARELAGRVGDPWMRQRLLARLALAQGDQHGAAAHYARALAVKPGCRITRLQLDRLEAGVATQG